MTSVGLQMLRTIQTHIVEMFTNGGLKDHYIVAFRAVAMQRPRGAHMYLSRF
jgi:hypothetical protein